MSRIALVTNSAAALPPELIVRYNIRLVPLQIHFIDGNYEEGSDIGLDEFYARLVREEVVPSTSPPPVLRYVRLFRALAADYDTILTIHMSTQMSGSYQNALAAAGQVSEAHVIAYDSGSAALGMGFQVLTAARLIERGADLDAILAALRHQRDHTLAVFSPVALRYIRNSRRVGSIVALLATWLNITPVIRMSGGKLELIERTRSWEAALDRQIAELTRFFEGTAPPEVGVCHSNAPAEASVFAERVRAYFPKAQMYITDVGAALAVHTGPGMLGIITYRT